MSPVSCLRLVSSSRLSCPCVVSFVGCPHVVLCLRGGRIVDDVKLSKTRDARLHSGSFTYSLRTLGLMIWG